MAILSLTLVIHAQAFQHIEMPFAPYDRAMLAKTHAFFAVAKFLVYILWYVYNVVNKKTSCWSISSPDKFLVYYCHFLTFLTFLFIFSMFLKNKKTL